MRVFFVFILILGAGFLGLWWLGNQNELIKIKNTASSDQAAKTHMHQAAQDVFSKFGGATPHDTLDLFVGALEKDDLSLASKYFSPSIRDDELHGLIKLKETGYLNQMILILKKAGGGIMVDVGHWKLEIADESGKDNAVEIDIEKNEAGFWKITSL